MFDLNMIGFEEMKDKFIDLPAEVMEEIDITCNDAAQFWEQEAKLSAPVRFGLLKGEIKGDKITDLNYEIVSPKFYSPYQEWGTGDRVQIPVDLIAYASQFRGTKHVKGIPPAHGTGFFFIHRQKVSDELEGHINNILNTEH